MRVRRSVATVCVLLVAASFAPSAFAQNLAAPQRVKNVEPVYPEEARLARIEGDVLVEATINLTGKVTDVEVLQSIPALDKAALDAVRQWEFTPTIVNGVALPVIMTVTVHFTLTPESPAGNDALDGSLRSDVEKLLAIVGATQMVSQPAGLLSESLLSGLKKSQPALSDRALEFAKEALDSELAKALVGPDSSSSS